MTTGEQVEDVAEHSSRRRWWIVGASAAALAAGAAVAVLLLTGGSGDPFTGYGKDAAEVAHRLGGCVSVERFSSVARCDGVEGSRIVVMTSDSETEQGYLIAIEQDDSPGDCLVVLDGVVFSARSKSDLEAVLGIPEAFASKHGGYVLCPVGG